MKKAIHQAILNVMTREKLSQSDLVKITKLSKQTINNLVNGRHINPTTAGFVIEKLGYWYEIRAFKKD